MTRLLTAAALIAALTVPAVATTESCAIVRKTPDGFLNMRYQPKMGAVIVGRLKPGSASDPSNLLGLEELKLGLHQVEFLASG
jgi:hypothetical protein